MVMFSVVCVLLYWLLVVYSMVRLLYGLGRLGKFLVSLLNIVMVLVEWFCFVKISFFVKCSCVLCGCFVSMVLVLVSVLVYCLVCISLLMLDILLVCVSVVGILNRVVIRLDNIVVLWVVLLIKLCKL